MKTTDSIDAARLELLLTDLRLPAVKLMWRKLAEQADKEGWPAARFLAALAEHAPTHHGVQIGRPMPASAVRHAITLGPTPS